VDGDVLSVSEVDSNSANGGTLTNNGDGTVTYAPPADFTGSDSFGYTVSDGNGGTDTALVTVDVQSAAATTMHVGDLDGTKDVMGKSGQWEVFVTATIHDGNELPVGGATVTGTWSGAASGTLSAITASDGTVTFSTGRLRSGTTVTFTVDSVSNGLTYEPNDNHDPDGDSDLDIDNIPSITVDKDSTSTSTPLLAALSGETKANETQELAALETPPVEQLPVSERPEYPPPVDEESVDRLLASDAGTESVDEAIDELLDSLTAD
jgi:hypothetical protein